MKNIYLIGNAHIDPVWLWRKSEGLSEILSTFRSALDRMKEFPDYIFTSACAFYYRWVEEIDPGMFREIQERVREGRWSITGGFWIQPDCNLPSGEAFCRHALYSQRYFLERLGIDAAVGYNVDSFGHNGMLPQLLKKSGMDYYVFMRPNALENPKLPDLFFWEAPDGSRVMVHKINCHYGDTGEDGDALGSCAAKIRELREKARESGLPYLGFYGVGNHGGGPTIQGLKALEENLKNSEDLCYASTGQYFHEIEESGKARNLPVIRGSLLHHASGCYAANSAIKRANRRAENALVKAERFDLLAQRLTGGGNSAQSQLKGAWEKVLFNQFHDILAGCSIRDAYREALNALSAACDTAWEVTQAALHRISWNIRTTKGLSQVPCQKNAWVLWEKKGEGAPVVVFNPHSFPVREIVQLNVTVSGVCDEAGKPVASQTVRGPQTNGEDCTNTIFAAELPAFGYGVYYVYKDQAFPHTLPAQATAGGTALENEFLKVCFDPFTGHIVSFYDKENRRELAAAPMAGAIVIDDQESDTWAHGRFVFDKEIGVMSRAKVDVLESGPLRAAIRVTLRYGSTVLRQDFFLGAHSRELTVSCKLNFHEELKLIKLSFPVLLQEPSAIYSLPYGWETRALSQEEMPSHKWMCVTSPDGVGLSLCNDSKYSFSALPHPRGAEMRMTIARGAIYADHFGKRDGLVEYQDQGEQFFCYTLSADTRVPSVVRRADLLNMPLELLLETHHEGPLAARYEGASISQDNIILSAVKQAEDGNGYVLRFRETAGRAASAEVLLPFLPAKISVSLGPQEIKTLRVIPETGSAEEISITEL